jgi:hypothetical protein
MQRKPDGQVMTADAARGPNFAVLASLAWLVIAVDLIARYWAGTGLAFDDTDDAMRLAQVHDFLHGQGWFDLHQARLAPPVGYDSHWSRLIDAGLAGTFLLFNQVVDGALAERLMRVVWPLMWLMPAILGVAAAAWRLAGREAAVVTLLLCVVGRPAFLQFLPGRIDHHNVQIALSVAIVAATVWSDRLRGTALLAGALSGLALGIGLENFAFVALAGVAFALRFVVDRAAAAALARYGASLAVSTAAVFVGLVAPDHWGRTACDAIAINWAVPMVAAGLLLWGGAVAFANERLATRVAVVAACGGIAGLVFVLIEPLCLAGPYAMVDPALGPIWFWYINEMLPLVTVMRETPEVAAALATFPAAAALMTLWLGREPALRRDFAFLVMAAELLVACGLMASVVKMSPYAMWLAMPLVAAFALRAFAWLRLGRLAARAFAAVLLTPALLSAGAIAAVQAASTPHTPDGDSRVLAGCFKTASYAQLARLPQGVIATDIDFGSYVLALTPHAVIAAPYHRLADGIIATHRIFTLPPDAARGILEKFGATYVVMCGSRMPPGMSAAKRAGSLWDRLESGAVPDWLDAVPAGDGEVFRVYRIKPHA